MSLLYPLYALAALGVVAPVLFHLFQRRPQGQVPFSSLLFLDPTPPKVTSRSRLSDLLLLLLRALALLLLAIAFARPFLRSASLMEVQAPSRSVVLLVDTSASMRRDGLWDDVQSRLKEVISDLRAIDDVALVRFDSEPTLEMSFEAWHNQAESGRLDWLGQQAEAMEPTWHRTNLSNALTYASDILLAQIANREDVESGRPLQIVLLSDLQEGGDLAALQSYQWPPEVNVDLKSVKARSVANASLQWLPPDLEEQDNQKIRVLIRNELESQEGQLELKWRAEDNAGIDSKDEVPKFATHVPPGQSRVVRLKQPVDADRLELTGDQQVFDNIQFIPVTKPEQQELWFAGKETEERDSLYFYLKQSYLDTRQRAVAMKTVDQPAALATLTAAKVPLVVMAAPWQKSAGDLKRYVASGGRVLITVTEEADPNDWVSFLDAFTGLSVSQIENVGSEDKSDYAMLSEIAFANPLFQPFADARFSDFTKIRFWSHRALSFANDGGWQALAKFDDGSPALIEAELTTGGDSTGKGSTDDASTGSGRVWILTSGWHPKESQLALSTKFVPLLHGFFGDDMNSSDNASRFEVGDAIPLRDPSRSPLTVRVPNGETVELEPGTEAFQETDAPGIYEIQEGQRSYKTAVNLAKEESRTTPLTPDRFEQLGIKLGEQRTVAATETEQRQMRNKELEGRQKFWRWGVVGALCLIACETWLSGRGNANTPTT